MSAFEPSAGCCAEALSRPLVRLQLRHQVTPYLDEKSQFCFSVGRFALDHWLTGQKPRG